MQTHLYKTPDCHNSNCETGDATTAAKCYDNREPSVDSDLN